MVGKELEVIFMYKLNFCLEFILFNKWCLELSLKSGNLRILFKNVEVILVVIGKMLIVVFLLGSGIRGVYEWGKE